MLLKVLTSRKVIFQLSLIVFIVCFCVGLGLSLRKPLWNDESFSQSQNIEMFSYKDLFLGKTLYEGNKCPLFYVMQKAFCQAAGYSFPYEWEQQWLIEDIKSQILLRLNPNFFMSLSIALIFFYFARYYSIGSGIYSILVTLSFFMVWFYWVDARPYAMWFFLSTVQLLLFLVLLKEEDKKVVSFSYRCLMLTNLAMAFTISIAVAQITIVSGFL